jgi:single-strand DNA-binding protein
MKLSDLDPDIDNWVFLRGRLADAPVARELPSGDVLTVFRLTVTRPEGERGRVDSLECSTVRPRARRSLERAEPGAQVEVTGSLRRRFWRTPTGPASRYAVEVDTVKLLRAGRPAGAGRARTPASA